MHKYIALLLSRCLRFQNECEKENWLCLTKSDSLKDFENIPQKNVIVVVPWFC